MDTTEESPVILSLCTGLVRGLERGIESAIGQPVRVAAFSEIETFAIENLLAGMEKGILAPTPIWTNLKTFPWQQFHGKVHGIVGGYPCQPFSNAGNRGGEEDPRHLWPFIAEGIRAIKPLWCFFENVSGHLTLGYETVRRELQEMGYHVEEGIFTAQEVGAPHKRERLFILAVLADSSINTVEEREVRKGVWREPESTSSKNVDHSYCPPTEYKIPTRGESASVSGETELANTNNGRSFQNSELCKLWTERTLKPSINSWRNDEREVSEVWQGNRWPSRPGEPQYDWEEPRTIKPEMGVAAHGYRFREDLLRGLGNGVVAQTAELAWKTLWSKM